MIRQDDLLRRLERRAGLFGIVGVAAALWLPGGGARLAAGVAGGALLTATSYWAIKRGVTGLSDAVLARGVRPHSARALGVLVLRYALLAGMAYVMIARLRLHPIGLLCGASVIPLAVAAEVLRQRS